MTAVFSHRAVQLGPKKLKYGARLMNTRIPRGSAVGGTPCSQKNTATLPRENEHFEPRI